MRLLLSQPSWDASGIDHVYQKYGAEMAVSISGDDIKTISHYYADPAQPVSIAALPENRTLHICICNTIRADSGQVESNKIGLRTAEKILTQMGGSFRRHEADGKFTAEAILPIVPEDADE